MTANTQQPEPAQPACSRCFYFRGSLCKRYPAPQRVPADHWCGEHDASPQRPVRRAGMFLAQD